MKLIRSILLALVIFAGLGFLASKLSTTNEPNTPTKESIYGYYTDSDYTSDLVKVVPNKPQTLAYDAPASFLNAESLIYYDSPDKIYALRLAITNFIEQERNIEVYRVTLKNNYIETSTAREGLVEVFINNDLESSMGIAFIWSVTDGDEGTYGWIVREWDKVSWDLPEGDFNRYPPLNVFGDETDGNR